MRATTNKTSPFGQAAVFIGFALALVLAIGWSTSAGQFGATIRGSLSSIMRLMFNAGLSNALEPIDTVLWQVHLPRIAPACLVGAGPALTGVALQTALGNPFAGPGLIGVSSGAVVGAATATVSGTAVGLSGMLGGVLSVFASSRAIAVPAFTGGAVTTAIVAANAYGGHDIARIILVDVAVNSIYGGLVSLPTFVTPTTIRDCIIFWQMDSFAGATWTQVVIITLVTVPAVIVMRVGYHKPGILSLGEAQARHLDTSAITLCRAIIFGTSLVVAAGVALSGTIVFIDSMVPHAVRLLLGPVHHTLVPACTLGGALATVLADLAARITITGAGLPPGMLISIAGGPLFFWLLLHPKRAVY